eukprot:scaffold167975_cov19-Tisochrysis_lutea.AAC.3
MLIIVVNWPYFPSSHACGRGEWVRHHDTHIHTRTAECLQESLLKQLQSSLARVVSEQQIQQSSKYGQQLPEQQLRQLTQQITEQCRGEGMQDIFESQHVCVCHSMHVCESMDVCVSPMMREEDEG